jgi:hypothetical protein
VGLSSENDAWVLYSSAGQKVKEGRGPQLDLAGLMNGTYRVVDSKSGRSFQLVKL